MISLLHGFAYGVEMVAAFALYFFIFKEKLRFSIKKTALCAAVLLFSCLLVLSSFTALAGIPPHPYASFLILLGCLLLPGLYFVTASIYEKLLMLFILKSYVDILALFTYKGLWLHFSSNATNTSIVLCLLSALALTGFTFWGLYRFSANSLRPIFKETAGMPFFKYLWILPLTFCLLYRFDVIPDHISDESKLGQLYYVHTYIWALSAIISYYAIFRVILSVSDNKKLEQQLHEAEIQTAIQRQHYKDLENDIKSFGNEQENFQHRIQALRQYASKKDVQSINNSLRDYLEGLDSIAPPSTICDNLPIAAVVHHFMTAAKNNGIHMTASVEIPNSLSFPETDICAVLSNLLENALEACIKQAAALRDSLPVTPLSPPLPFISINMGISGDRMLALSVTNSFAGGVKLAPSASISSAPIFLSSKPFRNNEAGLGIFSIRHIVEKYNGVVKFTYGPPTHLESLKPWALPHEIFEASVLLDPLSSGQK